VRTELMGGVAEKPSLAAAEAVVTHNIEESEQLV
jgi:hypothetical protein